MSTVTTTITDTSHMTNEDLVNFRRHLLGVLASVDLALKMRLTNQRKETRDFSQYK